MILPGKCCFSSNRRLGDGLVLDWQKDFRSALNPLQAIAFSPPRDSENLIAIKVTNKFLEFRRKWGERMQELWQ